MKQQSQSTLLAGFFFGFLASLIWGAWPVVSKLAASHNLSGWDITALRFAIAGCLLLPVFVLQTMKLKERMLKGLALTLGAGAPYSMLAMSGLDHAPSAHFGIIAPSTMLVFTTIGGYLWLKEPLKASRMAGIGLILAGVLFVSGQNLSDISSDTLLGDMMFVGCGLLWAGYTLLAKKWAIGPWASTAMVAVISMVVFLPLYFVKFGTQFLSASTDALLLQGIFQGVLSAIAALYFYAKAVSLLGSGKGAVFSALVPPIALLLGALILGETIGWVEYVGLGLVCMGMMLALELFYLSGKSLSGTGLTQPVKVTRG